MEGLTYTAPNGFETNYWFAIQYAILKDLNTVLLPIWISYKVNSKKYVWLITIPCHLEVVK